MPSWTDQLAAVLTGESRAIEAADVLVSKAEFARLADGCDSLEKLEADYRLLTADDLDVLANLTKLRQLKLTGPVDDAALASVAKLSTIEVLNLPDGSFTDEGLAQIAKMPKLELLRIGSPRVTDAGMASFSTMKTLRFLHLIDVPITDAGLIALHGMTQLESFYLDGSQCTDAGLRDLLTALPDLHFHQDQLHLPGDRHAHPHEK